MYLNKKKEKEKEATTTATTTATKPTVATQSKQALVEMEKDDRASKHLDKLMLYLRVVHSIDYYNATEYQQEDWMPNRLGIMHVRGPVDSKQLPAGEYIVNVINGVNINNNFFDKAALKRVQIDEWLRLFESHIRPYADYREKVELDIAKRLGLKDTKEEMEAFIALNCKKIEKNIWLCPLSGKKFKGPDYVRKHIETKHVEKLEELKKEVDYFNRFVYDPKRPYLPEHPLNKNMGNQSYFNNNTNNFSNNFQSMMPPAQNSYNDYSMSYANRPGIQGSFPAQGFPANSMPYQSPYANKPVFSQQAFSGGQYSSGYASNVSDGYSPYRNQSAVGGGNYYAPSPASSMDYGRGQMQYKLPRR